MCLLTSYKRSNHICVTFLDERWLKSRKRHNFFIQLSKCLFVGYWFTDIIKIFLFHLSLNWINWIKISLKSGIWHDFFNTVYFFFISALSVFVVIIKNGVFAFLFFDERQLKSGKWHGFWSFSPLLDLCKL